MKKSASICSLLVVKRGIKKGIFSGWYIQRKIKVAETLCTRPKTMFIYSKVYLSSGFAWHHSNICYGPSWRFYNLSRWHESREWWFNKRWCRFNFSIKSKRIGINFWITWNTIRISDTMLWFKRRGLRVLQ